MNLSINQLARIGTMLDRMSDRAKECLELEQEIREIIDAANREREAFERDMAPADESIPLPELEPVARPWRFGHGMADATMRRGTFSGAELDAMPVTVCRGQYEDEEYVRSIEFDEMLAEMPIDLAA